MNDKNKKYFTKFMKLLPKNLLLLKLDLSQNYFGESC